MSRSEEAQRAAALQRDMAAMHLEFRAAYERLTAYEVAYEQPHMLAERISEITVSSSKYLQLDTAFHIPIFP